jgi:hypothetical protein
MLNLQVDGPIESLFVDVNLDSSQFIFVKENTAARAHGQPLLALSAQQG